MRCQRSAFRGGSIPYDTIEAARVTDSTTGAVDGERSATRVAFPWRVEVLRPLSFEE
jgi:hypothetical protein